MPKKTSKKDPRSYSEFKWTIYTWYVMHTISLYAEQELKPMRTRMFRIPPPSLPPTSPQVDVKLIDGESKLSNTKKRKIRKGRNKADVPDPAMKYIKFLSILWRELPCPDCTEHYVGYLRTHPLNSKTDFHEWTVGLHNNVNQRLGNRTYSSHAARNFYMLDGKLVIDWWYYYFMVKTFANIAYTNNTISQFCKTLDTLRKVIPSSSLRKDLPKSKNFPNKRIFIRRYLIILKNRMDGVDPKVKQLRFTTKK